MLTAVRAYSSWRSAPILPLDPDGRSETDLLQIRNVDGLDPIQATVNTSLFGSVDGADYVGSSVPARNIVLTVGLNPDWDTWTYESLRRALYAYFMPKRLVQLVFESDDLVPVEISGIVEDFGGNIFSKDPEILVSVVCPKPYFTAIDPVVITGQSGEEEIIQYNGSVETGIRITVSALTGPNPSSIAVQVGEVAASYFAVNTSVDVDTYLDVSSIPMQKFVRNVRFADGVIANRLSAVQEGSSWPTLEPGENIFSVITDSGTQDWELTYFERFGGL